MHALWVAPPAVLLAGSVAVGLQLRRIVTQRSLVAEAVRAFASDRMTLGQLADETERVRATLEDLERR